MCLPGQCPAEPATATDAAAMARAGLAFLATADVTSLTSAEQARVLGLLVERVDYDGSQSKVTISFHPTGVRALADELAARAQEQRA